MSRAGEMDTNTVAEADADDMFAWEYSKENILPTRRGRKIEIVNEEIIG